MSRVEQIAHAIEQNHLATLREFAQGDGSELLVNAEMMRVSSGVPYPLLNFVARPRLERRHIAARIAALTQYFGERRLPFLVYLHPSAAASYMRTVMLTALEDPAVCVYLARLHGIPAGSVTLVLKAGVAGLYGLGTIPDCRGHGVGTSLMARAIFDANALGFRTAVLQAPPGAVRLYRRLGFETYFRIDIYTGG